MTTDPKTRRIRQLNDTFRKTFQGGKVYITKGIATLPKDLRPQMLMAVRTFTAFTEDNDPYGEHDFGAITLGGFKVFWKIDTYAPDMMHGSDDPADPAKTVRVLTIMLAEEY
ncbi:DUF3768 domain-containing protein [Roseibium aggregatum]|uniref:DUF3768 domain-containing protein n=1 Tax=Roseibium aggregatum TaxID=187304 RepID=A0A926P3L8_9HYPH|nr:DUF3768 domain-containing protein [Roseibium aggregatum]MBD1549540.1 DUF3768 domain-containing protein [Roseibium aggregatum]